MLMSNIALLGLKANVVKPEVSICISMTLVSTVWSPVADNKPKHDASECIQSDQTGAGQLKQSQEHNRWSGTH